MGEFIRKIALGTGQLYGRDILFKPGAAARSESCHGVLRAAFEAGIDLVDTAAEYTGVESAMANLGKDVAWNVVTKPPHVTDDISNSSIDGFVRSHTNAALQRLNRQFVYGLLLHTPGAFVGERGLALRAAFEAIKQDGLAKKVGVSVYTAEEIDRVLDVWTPDLVQIPLSLMDRRLIRSGHVQKLHNHGVEVHARSVFLQGALLTPGVDMPPHLTGLTPVLDCLDRGLGGYDRSRRLAACLAAVAGIAGVNRVILGLRFDGEIQEILAAADKAHELKLDCDEYALDDPTLVSPAHWPGASRPGSQAMLA